MPVLSFARRIAAACLLALAVQTPAFAGEGRVDATNGDTFFNVHFRFPPTPQQISDVKAALDMASFGICDATDGQWRVKKITLSQGQANEDKGDFWLHALPGRSGLSFFFSGANLGNPGSHVDMFSGAMTASDVYLHEFGHHAWGLGDEYDEQSRFGGPCGIGPGFEPGTTDEQNHSIMQQSGSAQCVGGPTPGAGCFRTTDCGAGGSCQFVLMSELSVASNNDPLQGDGNNCPAVAAPGMMCPDNNYCMRAWNSATTRYEQTQQSEIHNDDSDWETLDENYPFVTPPAALPVANAPPTCLRAVQYQEDVIGSDQVMLILDKSGSMSWSSNPADGDVCGNGVDDDGDGTIDEMSCGNARMTFVKAAANAYLDLQRDRNVDVGIVTFETGNSVDRMIDTLNAGNIAAYKAVVDGMTPGGNTGIGDAMETSKGEFIRVASFGRSRTAYLMTDGQNTSGTDPVTKANELRDIGVRVHVIPAGSDVSPDTLSGVAAATSGELFPAATMNDLTAIYAEMAGRHRGAAMALPRFNFQLSMRGGVSAPGQDVRRLSAKIPPRQRDFPILVEKNALSLVAFVSGRNQRMTDWSMAISLRGPNGEVFGPGSSELTVNPYYLFINVPNPAAGEWRLVAEATGPALQEATALAFIDNPEPDFFVSARPFVISGADAVDIAANPVFVAGLAEQGVTISGRIEGPQGFTAPVTMTRNETGAWSANEGPFPFTGVYRATLALDVDATAKPAEGEAIFAGPASPPISVTPFRRFGSASFVVLNGRTTPCPSGNRNDCDGDGVPDKAECQKFGPDIDKDGVPNSRDLDSDGDEMPDAIERTLDLNQNSVPDMCERGEPRTAPPPKSPTDNCVPLRASLISPKLVGKSWRLNDDNLSLLDFGADGAGAAQALSLIRKYRASHLCYVGKKGRSMTYLLADGAAPTGAVKGEQCTAFDPNTLGLTETKTGYALVSGKTTIRTFADKAEAESAIAVIRQYGFTNLCTAGADKTGLEYLRR
ncbi:MAG: vWA domain-containing protein [Parvularculaceae bacterium]|nr:vWA domain-containing protein [Parvularculaceae bacterium]